MIQILFQNEHKRNQSYTKNYRVCDLRSRTRKHLRSSLPPKSKKTFLPPHFKSSREFQNDDIIDRFYLKKKKRREDERIRRKRILKAYGAVTKHSKIDKDKSLTYVPSLENWKKKYTKKQQQQHAINSLKKSQSTPILMNTKLKKLNLYSLKKQNQSPEGRMKLRIHTKHKVKHDILPLESISRRVSKKNSSSIKIKLNFNHDKNSIYANNHSNNGRDRETDEEGEEDEFRKPIGRGRHSVENENNNPTSVEEENTCTNFHRERIHTDSFSLENGVLTMAQFEFSEAGLCHSKGTDQVSADEFLPLSLVGRGSCGVVYKAWYKTECKLVALKCINFRDPQKRDEILKELCTYREYPTTRNSIDFHGAYFHDDHIWFVLEYFHCGSLEEVVNKYGKFSEKMLRILGNKITLSMEELHLGNMIHRDIKPANILLGKHGDCKITDFGILTNLKDKESCTTVLGTHFYMSPERLSGRPYSYASDVWSFGLTLVVLITGSYPFTATSLYNQAIFSDTPFVDFVLQPSDDVSPELYDLINKCLTRKASLRPTASEILKHPFFYSSTADFSTSRSNNSSFSSSSRSNNSSGSNTFSNGEQNLDYSKFISLPYESRLEDCSRICWNLITNDIQLLPKLQCKKIGLQIGICPDVVRQIFRSMLLERVKLSVPQAN